MDVDLISLTGDTATGKTIQALAAGNLKRVHLELGGKAPFIVCADADIEAAARGATAGALINGGQDCTAATRAYVHRSVYDAFVARTAELFDSRARRRPVRSVDGPRHAHQPDPGRPGGRVRPARGRGRARGSPPAATGPTCPAIPDGAFYRPTLIVDCTQDSEIVQNEVFGPVLAVLPFDTIEEAFEKANDTIYGLAASIWTSDVRVAMEAARTLNFGHVQVNDHLMVTSEMPHGGFKQSGTGKDMSTYSFEEYTQVKHVMLELTGEAEKGWHYTVFGDKPAE